MADKDFDLSDIEAALAKVRNGLGKRRPAPTYYEVDVTLEELYTGCVKEVAHMRSTTRYSERCEATPRPCRSFAVACLLRHGAMSRVSAPCVHTHLTGRR